MPERRDHQLIYAITRRWLDVVAAGESLFLPVGPLWTPELINALYTVIGENPHLGSGGFQERLIAQARSIGPDAQRLAAEAMFVFQLKDASARAVIKRSQVEGLLAGVIPAVTIPDDLAEAFEFGMARYGSGRTRSLHDYLFVLRLARRWAQLPPAERRRLLDEPWAFRDLLDEVFEKSAVFAREATKHLVHPDTFEPSGSLRDKRQIVRALVGIRPNAHTDLDLELATLRERMERDGRAEEGFGFYDPDIQPTWRQHGGPATDTEDDVPPDQDAPPASGPAPLRRAAVELAAQEAGLRVDPGVVAALVAALNAGKHVVLTGAPGTAKTTLAELVAREAARAGQCEGHVLATATADWSTYETVGGYQPQRDTTLAFAPGLFLQAIADRRWLVLDEMNRANTDRALGPLFTVLSGQAVTLPAEQGGRPVRIRPASAPDDDAGFAGYTVPVGWRIIATTNILDRALLFDLSFALMRRFAFVEVSCPAPEDYRELVHEAVLDLRDTAQRARAEDIVASLLPLVEVRPLGPALFIDAGRFVAAYLTDRPEAPRAEVTLAAFFAYLLPQFEGADVREASSVRDLLIATAGRAERPAITAMLERTLGVAFLDRSVSAHDGDDDPEDEL